MREGDTARGSLLAPFRIRSFRFQWPADLCASWAFEMETLILGWYVLVETQSVLMLTIYASMQHLGTLLSPMFGVAGDRIGQRKLLSAMRGFYALLAATIMALALTGLISPYLVLGVAALMGMVRPSDIGMRTALVGETVPQSQLMGAMSVQRTTQDSARIAGALTGAGVMASLGMGPAYVAVTCLYLISCLLTLQTGERRPVGERPQKEAPAQSPLRDLKEGVVYVATTPYLLATMILAFLLNMTAFPLISSLQPYVAKEVYGADQQTLGYMSACAGLGAVAGSIAITRFGALINPARLMVHASVAWYLVLLVYSQIVTAGAGLFVLFFAGLAQSVAVVSMAAVLLRRSDQRFRGRIMGVRMLAIYSNMPGILAAGYLLPRFGFAAVAAAYCVFGILMTIAIVAYWRSALWNEGAEAR
jgi:predicted MFS family arabinose efflux permease